MRRLTDRPRHERQIPGRNVTHADCHPNYLPKSGRRLYVAARTPEAQSTRERHRSKMHKG